MKRTHCKARQNWEATVEAQGLTYHTHENGPYWNESAFYEFTATEILDLEKTVNGLHKLCIEAAGAVIENSWWDRLRIPQDAVPMILASWERDDFSLYGRFDLAYDGNGPAKLLEYNSDTPTALIEAAVAQWYWLEERHPHHDQWNSIHERLIAAWKRRQRASCVFASIADQGEDQQTVTYLRDTAIQAGIATQHLAVDTIGWNETQDKFVDLQENEITDLFKLYPWEWLHHEEFWPHYAKLVEQGRLHILEPAWKMLLSNKGILPILWELFPDHPNLLPSYKSSDRLGSTYVKKPILSREGANIMVVENGAVTASRDGDYGEEGYIFQAKFDLPNFDGNRPVLGAWIVDHESAGLGIREDDTIITGNRSRFVPHLIA